MIDRRRFNRLMVLAGGMTALGKLSLPRWSNAAMDLRYANFDLTTGAGDGTSEADAWRSWAAMTAGLAAGQHCYVKKTASRFDPGSATSFTNEGSDTQPLVMEGYRTTPGDGGDSGIANFFQYGSSSQNRMLDIQGRNAVFRYWDCETLQNFDGHRLSGENSLAYKCRFRNYGGNVAHGLRVLAGKAINCRVQTQITSGANAFSLMVDGDGMAIGCYVKDTGGSAILARLDNGSSNAMALIGCILVGAGTGAANIGVKFHGQSQGDDRRLVLNNSIAGCDVGILFGDIRNSGLGRNSVIGNIVYDVNTGMKSTDSEADAQYGVELMSNAVGAGNTRFDNLGEAPGLLPGDITLTADPWRDAPNDDYALNAAPGGGALCRGVQEPVDVAGDGTNLNRQDVGAVQDGS